MARPEVRRHARNNRELQAELKTIFATKTSDEWMEFGGRVNTPLAPFNSPKTLPEDPQFQARFDWLPASDVGADQMGFPVKFHGEALPAPAMAPTVGQHTDEVLRQVCDYDDDAIATLRGSGALG